MGVQTSNVDPKIAENEWSLEKKQPKSGCAAAHPAHPVPSTLPIQKLWLLILFIWLKFWKDSQMTQEISNFM